MDSPKDYNLLFQPSDEVLCTKLFWRYFRDHREAIESFLFFTSLAHDADHSRKVMGEALSEYYAATGREAEAAKIGSPRSSSASIVDKLHKFSRTYTKSIVVNTVDSYLWYLSNIVVEAMRRQPNLVRSSESMQVEDILEFSSRSELVHYLIERKVNSLSYGGIKALERFLSESMNVSLFRNEHEESLLRIFIEMRNVHTHNRGIVNGVFLDRAESSANDLGLVFRRGKNCFVSPDVLGDMVRSCVDSALNVDASVSRKFSMQRKKVSTWRKSVSAMEA